MTERDLLELIATQIGKLTTQVGGLTTKVDGLNAQVDNLTKDMTEVKADLRFTKNAVIRIENDHGQKLGALFDGYKLMSEKIDNIEKEVTRHEEIILRRID